MIALRWLSSCRQVYGSGLLVFAFSSQCHPLCWQPLRRTTILQPRRMQLHQDTSSGELPGLNLKQADGPTAAGGILDDDGPFGSPVQDKRQEPTCRPAVSQHYASSWF